MRIKKPPEDRSTQVYALLVFGYNTSMLLPAEHVTAMMTLLASCIALDRQFVGTENGGDSSGYTYTHPKAVDATFSLFDSDMLAVAYAAAALEEANKGKEAP